MHQALSSLMLFLLVFYYQLSISSAVPRQGCSMDGRASTCRNWLQGCLPNEERVGGVCNMASDCCAQVETTTKPAECADGETKVAEDGCNHCFCSGGHWGCTEMGCPEPEPEPTECTDIVDNCHTLLDKCKTPTMEKYCRKTCGVCKEVPCNKKGGEIKQLTDCYHPLILGCVTTDTCVCKEGFIGEACEHDCSHKYCPLIYAPVCGRTPDRYVTYGNECIFYGAKCDSKETKFAYKGPCQDDSVCKPLDDKECPFDAQVDYFDDTKNPGCKRCAMIFI